ncbi:MAG: B3/B4 domain-containing protein [Planctomycetota bacterium]|jgi:DNA/RNA-binding domain of Phe-tRNA-synthetase-like protein
MKLTLRLPIRAAVIEGGIRAAAARSTELADRLASCAASWRERHDGPPGDLQDVKVARDLFRALGIDPTRRRPSSEALLRRALRGDSMPTVNPAVDVGNWCSLEWLLPLGVYARDALQGDVVLRRGRADDAYDALNGRRMTFENRYVLVDDMGPFGSPMTDSLRTSVGPTTRGVFVVVYAPATFDALDLAERADELARRLCQYCGGHDMSTEVVAHAV